MRRTHIEHMLSALRPLATEERTFQIDSSVPRLGKPIQSGAVVRMASLEAVPTGAES